MTAATYGVLLQRGWTPQTLRTAAARGQLIRLAHGWYADPDGAWEARLSAALACHPLAVASHRTAAALRGLVARNPIVEITVPHGVSLARRPNLRVHSSTRQVPIELLDGLPVTSTVRTVLDVARTSPEVVGVIVADAALSAGACTREELLAALSSITCVPGAPTARRVVEACRVGSQSPMETTTRLVLVAAGLPEPVLQHPVTVAGRTLFLDLAWPEQKVCVEYDGQAFHSSPEQVAADRQRWRVLHDAGWDVRPITAADLRDGAALTTELRRSLGARVGNR